ncbi:hypothetical protein AMTR_s00009p00199000 [Amborella trichopoda]|uniref:Uncharacterized protein n=1 Tax=Amborella trichopoda TaxID=13333 RepID=W1NID3_AMBTC|nr:hypothetical protein AMTR_s00009p00199000 [Amborella trichopoda]
MTVAERTERYRSVTRRQGMAKAPMTATAFHRRSLIALHLIDLKGFAPSCKRKRDREMEKRLEPSATPPVVDKPREDKEEDVVEEEELEMVMQVKKKIKSGRKPMKARSLNSLL